MKRFALFGGLAALLMGCASQAPMVTTQPTVSVSNFTSVSFTPQRIEFDAKILIQNNAPVDLDVQKVDFAVDMYDQALFTDSFNRLKRTSANGTQTVAFPFHIAMNDVAAQAPDLLAEGVLRVTFRGQVFTAARYGLDPVPFSQTLEIPVPRLPAITYVGSEGEPFSDAFRLNFQVTNTNTFPLTLTSVKTFLVINGSKYSLLHTQKSVDVQPGETQPIALQMESSPGKTLRMALNLAQHPNPTFDITGTVTFNTPYGWIFIPVSLEEILQ
ncbi:MAG: LEA type 2 family protein [Spirochaetia bacterium]|jgi:LEA14-like dessication related protein